MKSDALVTEVQDECISIIRGLCEKNLKAVQPLLLTLKHNFKQGGNNYESTRNNFK